MAAEKGDSGAEAVALEIGSYMGEVISLLEDKNNLYLSKLPFKK
jgi:hypothetical protein